MTAENKIAVSIDGDLEDLIPGFLDNRRKDIESLKEALSVSNIESLKSIGHSLKGVGGGYGFDGLSEIGAEIESKAKSDDITGMDTLIENLTDYLDRVEITYE